MIEEKRNISLIAVMVLILVDGYFLFFNNETWIGFYYPNENNLTKHIQSPELGSLEECRAWVNSQVPIYNPSGYGYDYECDENCKLDKNYGLYVCKETLN